MLDYLIHIYRRGSEPFRSLSALSDAEALNHMQALYRAGAIFWERFQDPAQYLHARKHTEQWLRQAFIAKGGRPQAAYPIYMIWGRTRWMETIVDSMTLATTQEIQIPLEIFGEEDVSFTYPDSMVSAMLAHQQDPRYYLPEYHGQVFTLAEMRAIVESNGLPGERWGNNLPPSLANYIEAQVWNHTPLSTVTVT